MLPARVSGSRLEAASHPGTVSGRCSRRNRAPVSCRSCAPAIDPERIQRRLDRGEQTALLPMYGEPVLHGDNGSTLKATTVLATLQWLGVKRWYPRACVSDENVYAESLFRTARHWAEVPAQGVDAAINCCERRWEASRCRR